MALPSPTLTRLGLRGVRSSQHGHAGYTATTVVRNFSVATHANSSCSGLPPGPVVPPVGAPRGGDLNANNTPSNNRDRNLNNPNFHRTNFNSNRRKVSNNSNTNSPPKGPSPRVLKAAPTERRLLELLHEKNKVERCDLIDYVTALTRLVQLGGESASGSSASVSSDSDGMASKRRPLDRLERLKVWRLVLGEIEKGMEGLLSVRPGGNVSGDTGGTSFGGASTSRASTTSITSASATATVTDSISATSGRDSEIAGRKPVKVVPAKNLVSVLWCLAKAPEWVTTTMTPSNVNQNSNCSSVNLSHANMDHANMEIGETSQMTDEIRRIIQTIWRRSAEALLPVQVAHVADVDASSRGSSKIPSKLAQYHPSANPLHGNSSNHSLIKQFNARDVSQILWSFATYHNRCEEAAAASTASVSDQFRPRESIGDAVRDSDGDVGSLGSNADRRGQRATTNSMVDVVPELFRNNDNKSNNGKNNNYRKKTFLFDHILSEVDFIRNLPHYDPLQISTIVWSIATVQGHLGYYSGFHGVDAYCERIHRIPIGITNSDASQHWNTNSHAQANADARQHARNANAEQHNSNTQREQHCQLIETIVDHSLNSGPQGLGKFEEKGLSMLAWSLTKMGSKAKIKGVNVNCENSERHVLKPNGRCVEANEKCFDTNEKSFSSDFVVCLYPQRRVQKLQALVTRIQEELCRRITVKGNSFPGKGHSFPGNQQHHTSVNHQHQREYHHHHHQQQHHQHQYPQHGRQLQEQHLISSSQVLSNVWWAATRLHLPPSQRFLELTHSCLDRDSQACLFTMQDLSLVWRSVSAELREIVGVQQGGFMDVRSGGFMDARPNRSGRVNENSSVGGKQIRNESGSANECAVTVDCNENTVNHNESTGMVTSFRASRLRNLNSEEIERFKVTCRKIFEGILSSGRERQLKTYLDLHKRMFLGRMSSSGSIAKGSMSMTNGSMGIMNVLTGPQNPQNQKQEMHGQPSASNNSSNSGRISDGFEAIVVSMVWGCAASGVVDKKFLFDFLGKMLVQRVDQPQVCAPDINNTMSGNSLLSLFSPQSISLILWSYAKLGYDDLTLFSAASEAFASGGNETESISISSRRSTTTTTTSKSLPNSSPLPPKLAAATARDLSVTLWSFAKVLGKGETGPDDRVRCGVVNGIGNSNGSSNSTGNDCQDAKNQALIRRNRDPNFESRKKAIMMPRASSNDNLINLLFNASIQKLPEFSPRQMSTFIYSWAVLQILPEKLPLFLANWRIPDVGRSHQVGFCCRDFSCQDLGNIVWAFAVMWEPIMEASQRTPNKDAAHRIPIVKEAAHRTPIFKDVSMGRDGDGNANSTKKAATNPNAAIGLKRRDNMPRTEVPALQSVLKEVGRRLVVEKQEAVANRSTFQYDQQSLCNLLWSLSVFGVEPDTFSLLLYNRVVETLWSQLRDGSTHTNQQLGGKFNSTNSNIINNPNQSLSLRHAHQICYSGLALAEDGGLSKVSTEVKDLLKVAHKICAGTESISESMTQVQVYEILKNIEKRDIQNNLIRMECESSAGGVSTAGVSPGGVNAGSVGTNVVVEINTDKHAKASSGDGANKNGVANSDSVHHNSSHTPFRWQQEHPICELLHVDVACPDNKVAVEVNGPNHYLAVSSRAGAEPGSPGAPGRIPNVIHTGSSDRRYLNGKTILKTRLLERFGWKVVMVDTEDWKRCRDVRAKRELLIRELARTRRYR